MPLPPLMISPLYDGVVSLRAFEERDASGLVEIWRDPSIRARNTVPEPTHSAALEWIARSAANAASGTAWEWAVVDADTGVLAGRRAMKVVSAADGRVGAACWIAAPFRGRRFAPRSLRLAARHCFDAGVVRVQAHCEADNVASIRSVTAAGMRLEGTLRAHWTGRAGERIDAQLFSLLEDDLAASASTVMPASGG